MKRRSKNRGIMYLSLMAFAILCSFTVLWAKEPDTLNFSTIWEAESLDPVQCGAVESVNAINPLYDTLVDLKGGGPEAVPMLAESWEVSKDGKTFTFHLRKGVKFHDGTELTAEDVRYSFERLLKTRLQPPANQMYDMGVRVDKLRVADPYTFIVELEKPSPRFLGNLSQPLGRGVVKKDYVKQHATEGDPYALSWMRDHAMGTGPWKLEKWSVNEKIIFTRNDEYWGEKPHFKRLIINVIKDPTVAHMMLEKGDLDIACKLKRDQYSALEKVKGIVVKSNPTLKTVYMRINCVKKPFDDVRVRQALNYAINYDELIKVVEQGKASRLYTTIPVGMFRSHPDPKPNYHYDPDKARSLLKAAGVKGLEVNLLYSLDRHVQFEDMVPYIISYLKDIGIVGRAQKIAFTTQLALMKNREYDLAMDTWNSYFQDYTNSALSFYRSDIWKAKGWSFAFWESKRFDELLRKAEDNMNSGEREKQYHEAEQIVVENAVAVPFYQLMDAIAMGDDIKNLSWNPTLWYKQFKSVYREK